jgi:Asp-tRNA(Asn)/Glu-tRNA(Gln) amidotransferase C subunit
LPRSAAAQRSSSASASFLPDLAEGDAERFVEQFADILEAFDALEEVPDD